MDTPRQGCSCAIQGYLVVRNPCVHDDQDVVGSPFAESDVQPRHPTRLDLVPLVLHGHFPRGLREDVQWPDGIQDECPVLAFIIRYNDAGAGGSQPGQLHPGAGHRLSLLVGHLADEVSSLSRRGRCNGQQRDGQNRWPKAVGLPCAHKRYLRKKA